VPQFFLPLDAGPLKEESAFRLTGPEAFHLVKVLRHKPGDVITVLDGKGGRFEGVIDRVDGEAVVGRVLKKLASAKKSAELRLYQGLLKASHWDDVLDKATQLGVASITPILTPRTVVILREGKAQAKKERWQRVVEAATKQCQRPTVPIIGEPAEFRDAIRAARADEGAVTLVAWEGLCGESAAAKLRPALAEAKAVNVFIGPEGGFTDDEIELADSLGASTFGLGPRVLRSETAAVAACALVQYELGAL